MAQTLHSQDPPGMTVLQFWQTLWLHILHWLEKMVSRLRGSWHLAQLRGLYFPLPRFAPFLFTSSNSVFSFLKQKLQQFSSKWHIYINWLHVVNKIGGSSDRTRFSSACLSSSSRCSTSRINSCSYSDRKPRLSMSTGWGIVPSVRTLGTGKRCRVDSVTWRICPETEHQQRYYKSASTDYMVTFNVTNFYRNDFTTGEVFFLNLM